MQRKLGNFAAVQAQLNNVTLRKATKVTGKLRLQRRLDLAIREGRMAYQDVEEDEAEQKVDAVDAKIEIEQDLMTKTEMNARIPIDATTATHLGMEIEADLLAALLLITKGLTAPLQRKLRL